ncbi:MULTISPECIES: hypothetical protein [Streptomyces]|uniref:Uncharacterized protein n=1 Tax=Streptomyces qinglanensis TaxID=943816 RepID=A0A1E7K529_9ACTN|nr:hypothetical protein [Streptomyces qinglanensis]MBE9499903.1 hypothetical protein [Streptomyces sp. GKU 257-1]OEU99030.1 hypothetical protein AN217_15780 [Streptomyces qinglanensis]
MSRPARQRAAVPYAISATCAVVGALLWVRGHDRMAQPPRSYGAYLAADGYTPSTWRVWSSALPQDRLGLYLVVFGILLAVGTRVFLARRG